jgi:titin
VRYATVLAGCFVLAIGTGLPMAVQPVRAAATFTVNRTGDAADLNLANTACDVSTTAGNQCTLRAALQEANDTPGDDIINFNITSASKVIAPASPLPVAMENVTINGYSQSGASPNTAATGNNAVLKIVLDGINAGAGTNGLVFDSDKGVVKGLVIQRFDGDGVVVNGSTITVEGNFIGTNAAGDTSRPNRIGVLVTGDHNDIGLGTPQSRNLISGNELFGISIFGADADTNSVSGNYIGTRKGGGAALPNGDDGIQISGGTANIIGGFDAASANVISANGDNGIYITMADRNAIYRNRIGTNAAGDAALGNQGHGVFVHDSDSIQVGTADHGNVISGNGLAGVDFNAVNDSFVQGNKIGTNAAGTAAIGNSGWGIFFTGAEDNLIGGTTAGARNTVSGNLGGIQLLAAANTVRGNRIGTKADGTGNLGNELEGIFVGGALNTIGGSGALGNVIVGSQTSAGVLISGFSASGNVITGNSITGNAGAGVKVLTGGNQISGNSIVANGAEGVLVDSTSPATAAVLISVNVMIANARLGINLVKATDPVSGVTDNDAGDGDGGANRLQNFPVLTSAVRTSNGVTTVIGSLNSVAGTQFKVELFIAAPDPSGHGEAQAPLASQNVTTNSSGNKGFTFSVAGLSPGIQLTATATNLANNDTSEFSFNIVVTIPR